jgi:hypothetical protein
VAKQAKPKDPIELARKKLADAQLALSVAENKHAQAREQGKQEVEKARLRAARWLAKTSAKVEKRSAGVIRAEARLIALTVDAAGLDKKSKKSKQPRIQVRKATEPAVTAEEPEPAIEPEEAAVSDAGTGLRARDLQALHALPLEGATAQVWRQAAQMKSTTFGRARQELLERHLVTVDGGSGPNAHYVLTDAAKALD